MIENICQLPTYQHVLIIILVQIILGVINIFMSKSENIKSNSVSELIFNIVVSIVKRLFTKRT
jgi:hypothetical protein